MPMSIEDRCECGHSRSEHRDTWARIGTKIYRHEGYGRCGAASCPCYQFRWAGSSEYSCVPGLKRNRAAERTTASFTTCG